MPEATAPVRITGSHTIVARDPEWFIEPASVASPRAHAFRGIRCLCGALLWTAAWRIAGTLVDGAEVPSCPGCVQLVDRAGL